MAITRLRGFAADRSGAVAIEYAVLVSGIALTLAMTVSLLGDRMVNTYSDIAAAIIDFVDVDDAHAFFALRAYT